jgi:alkanesulfonate monooxygenase
VLPGEGDSVSSGLRFSWYAPTHGDGHIIGGRSAGLEWSPRYIDRVAGEAEAAGFDMILLPAGPGCADAMVTAAHIAAATTSLRLLVAVRPGSVPPTILAKSAATLDHVSCGRMCLNIVTGGSPAELAMDGDHEPHDRRYARTAEFMTVLRRAWAEDGVDFDGEFFRIVNASFVPKPVRPGGIPLYVGGSSPAAVEVAAELADVYLMWGEPRDAVAAQVDRVRLAAAALGRAPRFGMRINLVVDEYSEVAWQRATAMREMVDPEMARRAESYIRDSDSTALARIQALSGRDHDDPAFWTGMVPFRSGNSTALVGSVDEVVASLRGYVRAGISEFIFSSYPHRDTVKLVGTRVLPALRENC